VNLVHNFTHLKNNPISSKSQKVYTEAPWFFTNCELTPSFEEISKSSPCRFSF
jgi:hypothetical protein